VSGVSSVTMLSQLYNWDIKPTIKQTSET